MMPPPAYAPAINGYNRFTEDAAPTPPAPMATHPWAAPQPQMNQLNLALAGGQPAGPKPLRSKKAILGLGITQIIVGVLLAVFSIVLIAGSAGDPYHYGILGIDASGIWGGVLTGIAGIFAVLVAAHASKCRLVACMVLSIIAAVAAGIGIILDGIWTGTAEYMAKGRTYYWSSDRQPNPAPLVGCAAGIALSIINIAVSTICASLMCANASCCCCSDKQAKTVVVAIPMENINDVLSKNNAGANANIIVMPYKP